MDSSIDLLVSAAAIITAVLVFISRFRPIKKPPVAPPPDAGRKATDDLHERAVARVLEDHQDEVEKVEAAAKTEAPAEALADLFNKRR